MGNIKTALIVDDSSFMRTFIGKLISDQGLTVVGEAENGKIGVEKYKELKPDIVFMDIVMEEMMGFEALKEIIEYDPDAVVIMISSAVEQDYMAGQAKSLGAKAVVLKPPTPKDIEEALAGL